MKKTIFLSLLFFQLFILTALSQNVLIIYDDSPTNTNTLSLKSGLESRGMSVTISDVSETQWDNSNPSLTGFDAVVHLNGTTYDQEMPLSGQTALVDYVQNQGGLYVGFEWNAYEIENGRMTTMQDLILFTRINGGQGSLTYTAVGSQAGNPLLQGVTSPFTFTNSGFNVGSVMVFSQNQPTVLMTDDDASDAVAIRDFGLGRVLGFNSAGNFSGFDALSNLNLQTIIANAVNPIGVATITCPGDITQNNDTGICGAVVNYSSPTITPGDIAGFTTLGIMNGRAFYLSNTAFNGPNAFTDAISNGGFVVTIEDAQMNNYIKNRVAVVAGNITYYIGLNDAVQEGTFVWQSGVPVSYTNWVPGEPNDSSGNEDYVEVNSIVGLWNDINSTHQYVLELPIAIVQTAGLPSGSEFPVGTTTNTFMVTDISGNTAECSFDVIVNDTEAPVVTCPGDITQSNDAGICGAVVTFADPTVTDNCSGGAVSQEFIQNGGFETGDFSGWSVVDTGSGSYYINDGTFFPTSGTGALAPISGSFDVVTDQGGPGLHLLSQPFTVPSDVQNATVSWNDRIRNAAPDFSDPNQEFRVDLVDAAMNVIQEVYSTNPGDPTTQIGPNFRQFDLTSLLQTLGGQQVSLSFSEQDELGNFNVTLDDISLIVGSISISQTAGLPSGSEFPVGTTTNTFEVTDASGNTASCSFDVIVNDTESPEITCAGDITQDNDAGICGAFVTIPQPVVSDNCSSALLPNNSLNFDGINDFVDVSSAVGLPQGTSSRSVEAWVKTSQTNIGNILSWGTRTSQQRNSVAVRNGRFAFIGEINDLTGTVPINNGQWHYVVFTYDGSAIQLFVDGVLDISANRSLATNGQNLRIGTIALPSSGEFFNGTMDEVRVWNKALSTAEIQNNFLNPQVSPSSTGLLAYYNFDEGVADVDNAGVTTLFDLTANNFNGTLTNFALNGPNSNWVGGSPSDSYLTLVNDFNNSDNASGTYPVGTTTVTWTATDASGNTANCSFDVIVNDTEVPTAVCQPITVQLDANGTVSIVAADVDGGSTDNCGVDTIAIDIDTFDCSNVGDNNVVLTLTDVNGNTSTCTAVVTVEDNIAPTAVCQPITVQLDSNGTVSIVASDVDGGSTDNCGVDTLAIDIDTFDCSNVGDIDVVLTVTDVNGNASTCTAVVTVEDNIAPSITCPANITVNTDLGNCSALVFFPMPIALDNCGIDTLVQTMGDPSGSNFTVGLSTIEFTTTDVNGNVSTCSFIITVVDNEAPVAVCQSITIQLDEFGNASIVASDVDGGSTDQCGVASITIDIDTFDCSNVGDNNVILTVTDVNGNVSTCTAIVTVEDVTAPVVACQSITVELDANGTVTVLGSDIDNGSTDACGIDTYTLDIDTFDCSNIGDNPVVLTVTDVNGNSATCTAIVMVEDNTSPVLVCQDFTIEIGTDGTATLSPSDVIASNDDACGILTVAVDITEFSCADIGTPVTVQIFSQDNNGNLASCTATVTAVDLLAPVVTCPGDQTVDPGQGNLFYILPDYFATGEATAVDNCTDPVTITSQDPAVGTPLPDGVYTITLTATDEYGNVGTCEFELTVDTVLGAGENSQNLGSITMYPNPAKGQVTISNPQSLTLESVAIYDLMGRLVNSYSLKGMTTAKTLDIENLAAATYMVIIKGKEGQITKRLIKE